MILNYLETRDKSVPQHHNTLDKRDPRFQSRYPRHQGKVPFRPPGLFPGNAPHKWNFENVLHKTGSRTRKFACVFRFLVLIRPIMLKSYYGCKLIYPSRSKLNQLPSFSRYTLQASLHNRHSRLNRYSRCNH